MAENNVNTTVVETPEMEKRFHDEYTVKMIRSGRLTTLIAADLPAGPVSLVRPGHQAHLEPDRLRLGHHPLLLLPDLLL